MAKCAPASTLAWKRAISLSRSSAIGIQRDADGEICLAAKSFAGPVRALIEAMQNFGEADGIDFVDAAGFRIIADGWRITGDAEDVAHAADGPRAEQAWPASR